MSFDPLRHHPRVRRIAPWVAWGAVLLLVLWLAPGVGAVGVVAASAEVRQATVVAPRTARVMRMHVAPGDRVEPGAVLLELDPSGIDFELAIARVELERLRGAVTARELDVRSNDFESAARLAQEAERAAVDLVALLSQEKRDRAELLQLDELIARQQALVEQRLTSAEQRDALLLQRASVAQHVQEYGGLVQTARAHEQAARARLQAWRASTVPGAATPPSPDPTSGSASAPRTGTKDTLASADWRIAPERGEVLAQEERVRQLELARDALVVRAPLAARVAEVFVGFGDTARAEQAIAVLVDENPRTVVAWIDERAAQRVDVGTRASLRPSDRSGPARDGVVRAVAPFISELPTRFRPIPTQPSFGRAVYISLADGTAPPLPGQAFDVMFAGGT